VTKTNYLWLHSASGEMILLYTVMQQKLRTSISQYNTGSWQCANLKFGEMSEAMMDSKQHSSTMTHAHTHTLLCIFDVFHS